jgi:hypothetical protein
MGMLYLLELPLIIIGIIYLIRKRNRFITVLLMLFLLAPVPSSVTTGTPHPVRAIAMIPGFQIFTAVGFYFLVTYLQNKKYSKILIAAVIGLFIVNIIYYLHSYYIETPIRYGYFWQYGNKEAVQFAKQYEKKYKHIIMTYTYDQPYIYYLFHNKIDPSWYQKNWNYSGNGSVDRFYRKIGKYEFAAITPEHLTRENTMIIGTPDEIPVGSGKTLKEIIFPDGRIAYKIIEL